MAAPGKRTHRQKSRPPKSPGRVLRLDGESLDRDSLRPLAAGERRLALAPSARRAVKRSRRVVEKILADGEVAYGINTGFGRLCRIRISGPQIRRLQANLLRSHGTGVGDPLCDAVVRLALAFRANALARGNSGIRVETVELLLALYNEGVLPWIPEQGSVGASGDLAPLAHLGQVLIGEGRASVDGRLLTGRKALAARGLEPLRLEAKEGLSLINGVQVSTAILVEALLRVERLLEAAAVAAAVTTDALLGSFGPLDPRIHEVRPHHGPGVVATRLRELLAGSPLNLSHQDCGKVQDAYSLRCVPQVHGAVHDAAEFVWQTVLTEINSATDNPLVFADSGDVLSGGNFHGAPVGYAADLLGIAIADLGSIAERRIERLVNPDLSELPAFLARREGVESGFMMAHVTAAALVSENKVLAHPASVDTVPTSAGTEDHVSMSTHAARKARDIVRNVEYVLAIELLVAIAALELRRPLRSGKVLERCVARFRERVPQQSGDRDLTGEISAAVEVIRSGDLF